MMEERQSGHRERLRQRFQRGEESSRSETALLELLLTFAIPRKDVEPLSRKLIAEFGSLSGVLGAPFESLCGTDGIKSNSAVLLKIVDWIRSQYGPKQDAAEASPPEQQGLFGGLPGTEIKKRPVAKKITPRREKPLPRRGTGMFGKAMLQEAIQILPSLPDTESLDEVRSFLWSKLHFNAEQTRKRNAAYIIRRMFPEGYADRPLRSFSQAFADAQELRDVCFYRFLKSEPLEVEIIESLLLPNIGTGRLSRELIRRRLTEKFPEARSIADCGKAIVDALISGGIVKADRTKISFAYRDVLLPSFAFVLHSEFPEPDMHDIKGVEENSLIRAMLWNPERLLPSLYELRNCGLISKISEIDNMRQFTTRYTLGEIVEKLVSGGKRL